MVCVRLWKLWIPSKTFWVRAWKMGKSRKQKGRSAAAEVSADGSAIDSTENSAQNEVRKEVAETNVGQIDLGELREALVSETRTSELLRVRVSHLEEQVASSHLNEAVLQEEIRGLRQEIRSLIDKVNDLESNLHGIARERDEILSKVSELESHTVQPNPEASHTSKKSGEAVEAALVADDLKLQQTAAAAMMEKLVAETAELTCKVNEQSLVISQLTGATKSHIDNSEKEVIVKEIELNSGSISTAPVSNGIARRGIEVDSQEFEVNQKRVGQVEADDLCHSQKNQAQVDANDDEGKLSQAKLKDEPSPVSAIKGELRGAGQGKDGVVPFSDAPLMGAPIRVLSFVARFVTGADLVKTEK